MRVLIACEFSGIVREAFRALGHDAWSCDLIGSELPGSHHQGDVLEFIRCTPYLFDPHTKWDLMIAHPPCQFLALSGVRWLYQNGRGTVPNLERWQSMREGAQFFAALLNANIPRIAVENPKPHGYALEIMGHQHNQIIHPWQFGHGETKETRLWLKNLPLLQPTKIVNERKPRVHYASPGPERWKERSRTLQGIADAMAAQWGSL